MAVHDKLIDTLSRSRGGNSNRLVRLGIEPQGKAPRLLLGGDPLFRTDLQKDFQRDFTFALQPFQIGGVKIRRAVESDELTPEHLDFRVIGNDGLVAVFKCHDIIHGFTPWLSNQIRTLATAPLSVVGAGCGR